MRVGLLAASLLLTSALVSAAGAAAITMSPPPAQNAPDKTQPKVLPAPATAKPSPPAKTEIAAKAERLCNCPPVAPHASARKPGARHARAGYYHYAAAAPWHGQWRVAPPAPRYEVEGLRIDDGGWTGGVGYAPDGGGGGGGFVDGYGQVHFANGGGVENGPTYNSYGQSFQFNPSQAGPFQPRSMGGFAPPSTGSR